MATQMKSMRVNTNEEEEVDVDDLDGVQIVKESSNSKRKCIIIGGCGIILFLALIVILILLSFGLFCQKENETETTKEEAVDLLNNLDGNYNFTDYDLVLFDEAFNTFDHNDDGFLNQTEFSQYISIKLSNNGTFGVIDVDNDKILSYPEVVAYLTEMIKNEYLFNTYFKHNIIPMVEYHFNYNYSHSDPVFIEYAAFSMYFKSFDTDSNGYITYKEYLLFISKDEFDFTDENSDGLLSKNEFFNVLYGNNNNSFKGVLNSLFDDENKFIQSMNNIKLTMEKVENVEISLCPIKSPADAPMRRLVTLICEEHTAKSEKLETLYYCCTPEGEDPDYSKCIFLRCLRGCD